MLIIISHNSSSKCSITPINRKQGYTLNASLYELSLKSKRGRGGLVVRSWACGRRVPQARNPISLKIHRAWGLLYAKSYVVAKRSPPPAAAWKLGEGACQPRCRPRHRTVVQNYEVRPKIALVLLSNVTLI
ncbi:hypothetical protein AVEN_188220-1 [Araneus ventricosus]|uniref:Uncharacterized protein n=1 Tax=Araneus ventricosus TaxID=182803 RepID=A0A4Y2U1T9_ARAVE|nr:hypothetical protein AVEN_108669-1 [Araneus ventricosus]GBO06503.1 hypothetical protein AVEN_188220-1 [Araneus ventricosus]